MNITPERLQAAAVMLCNVETLRARALEEADLLYPELDWPDPHVYFACTVSLRHQSPPQLLHLLDETVEGTAEYPITPAAGYATLTEAIEACKDAWQTHAEEAKAQHRRHVYQAGTELDDFAFVCRQLRYLETELEQAPG